MHSRARGYKTGITRFISWLPVVNNKYISIASDQKNSLFYLQGYPKVLFVMFALIRSVVFFFLSFKEHLLYSI